MPILDTDLLSVSRSWHVNVGAWSVHLRTQAQPTVHLVIEEWIPSGQVLQQNSLNIKSSWSPGTDCDHSQTLRDEAIAWTVLLVKVLTLLTMTCCRLTVLDFAHQVRWDSEPAYRRKQFACVRTSLLGETGLGPSACAGMCITLIVVIVISLCAVWHGSTADEQQQQRYAARPCSGLMWQTRIPATADGSSCLVMVHLLLRVTAHFQHAQLYCGCISSGLNLPICLQKIAMCIGLRQRCAAPSHASCTAGQAWHQQFLQRSRGS